MKRTCVGCGQKQCGACCGSSCTGCGGTLSLTQGEIDLLLHLGQIPFLPVGRRADWDKPVYLEEGPEDAQTLAPFLSALSQKGLIRLDYDLPLSNFDYKGYESCVQKGSMTLTARGQQVVEQLEIQGIEE